jgi:hypothetical protein
VDLQACRNSGGRSFGGFFGVCDAVSCILSDTGSLSLSPFFGCRRRHRRRRGTSHRLMIGVFFFPDFFPFVFFFGKDARAVVLNAFRSCSKIIFC